MHSVNIRGVIGGATTVELSNKHGVVVKVVTVDSVVEEVNI